MENEQWKIGTIFGIPLYLDPSWFLIVLFLTIVNGQEINDQGVLFPGHPFLAWVTGLILALGLFASVLLHELGHSLTAKSQGIKVNSITLFLFGGIASIDQESKTPEEALNVAVAGPLVSFMLFLLLSLLMEVISWHPVLTFLMSELAQINLIIAIFNLIPGLPLDGGQILKAMVWKQTGDRLIGVHSASLTGKIFGCFGIIFGFLLVLLTGSVGGGWMTLIGWFILKNAHFYDHMTTVQEAMRDLKAGEVMSDSYRVVNAHLTIQDFMENYVNTELRANMSYFSASEGRYRGLIKVEELRLIPEDQWGEITLFDRVYPLTEIPSVTEKTPLFEVIKILETLQELKVTVLSPAGAVAGMVDRGDIVQGMVDKYHFSISETEIKRIKTEGTYPAEFQLQLIANQFND